jgi:hypothetical protein
VSLTQEHYEILVTVQTGGVTRFGFEPEYRHLFATDMRSCVTQKAMQDVYDHIRERFPEPQFQVTVTKVHCYGTQVEAYPS